MNIAEKTAAQYRTQARAIELAAILLEAFAIALVINWAYHSQTSQVLAVICVGAFIGFELARVYTVPLLVNAIKARHWGMVILGFVLVLATLLVLFAATVFENVNKSDEGVNERVLNSPAMKALELEIGQTRDKIASLAAFSNPEKAHAETQELKANEQARIAKIEKTKAQINGLLNGTPKNKAGESAGSSLSALTAGCSNGNWYDKSYCGEVRNLKAQLKSLENGSAGGDASYNARYDEYNGLQTHLTSLEKQRAQLLTSQGEGVINAYRPEDTLIASLFGINPQSASFVKWLVFSAVLDLLGLGLRFLASMARFRANQEVDPEALAREIAKKGAALITLYGAEAAKKYLSSGLPNLTLASIEPAAEHADHKRSTKRSDPEERKFDDLPMPMTARAETTEPPKKFGFGFMPNDNVNNDTVSQLVNHQPIHNEMATRHESYERVSNETSGKAGKDRVGKIDSCIECNDDYIVKSHHQIRCPECSNKAREQFVKTGLNR